MSIQVIWKCDTEIVSIQLSHRTQNSARSTEYRATARACESWYRLLLKTIISFSCSGADACASAGASTLRRSWQLRSKCRRHFNNFSRRGAGIVALETQLQIESARAQTAEKERSALIQTLVTIRQERAGGMVESTGISQPFTLKGHRAVPSHSTLANSTLANSTNTLSNYSTLANSTLANSWCGGSDTNHTHTTHTLTPHTLTPHTTHTTHTPHTHHTHRGGAPRGGAPRGGAPRSGAPRSGAPRSGAPRGGAQNFALFSLSRHNFLSFFSLLGILSWNFGGV